MHFRSLGLAPGKCRVKCNPMFCKGASRRGRMLFRSPGLAPGECRVKCNPMFCKDASRRGNILQLCSQRFRSVLYQKYLSFLAAAHSQRESKVPEKLTAQK